MRQFFGTDGIRGQVNCYPVTWEKKLAQTWSRKLAALITGEIGP